MFGVSYTTTKDTETTGFVSAEKLSSIVDEINNYGKVTSVVRVSDFDEEQKAKYMIMYNAYHYYGD